MSKVERYEWRWKLACSVESLGHAFERIGQYLIRLSWRMVRWTAKP
jgi:hypothetical protein